MHILHEDDDGEEGDEDEVRDKDEDEEHVERKSKLTGSRSSLLASLEST